MYYLSDFCSLCLAHKKTCILLTNLDVKLLDILECIIPENIFQKSVIPKNICNDCLNSLNSFLKFIQRCSINISIFNEYVQKLKQEFGENENLIVASVDIFHQKKCEISNDNHKEDDTVAEEPINKVEEVQIKNEIFETVDYKFNEEITVKEDFSEDNMEGKLKIKSEPSYNVGLSSRNHVITNDSNENDSESDFTVPNEINEQENQDEEKVSNNEYSESLPELPKNKNIPKSILNKKRQHVCDICQKTFTQINHLKAHKRVHDSIKSFACDTCQKTFTRINNLKVHERIHNNIRPFECDICQKKFNHVSNLNIHKRIHSGIKPYSCELCQKTFTHKSNLNYHKSSHSKSKSYECDVCQKTFSYIGNLKVHKRIHNNIRPYACEICQKAFTQLSNLKSHKRIHDNTIVGFTMTKMQVTVKCLHHVLSVHCTTYNQVIQIKERTRMLSEENEIDGIESDTEKKSISGEEKEDSVYMYSALQQHNFDVPHLSEVLRQFTFFFCLSRYWLE